jgi:hypothetical protein
MAVVGQLLLYFLLIFSITLLTLQKLYDSQNTKNNKTIRNIVHYIYIGEFHLVVNVS